jgi:hypothetical protein
MKKRKRTKRGWDERLRGRRHVNAETGCWEWTGHLNYHGYGNFTISSEVIEGKLCQKKIMVHQAAAVVWLGHVMGTAIQVLHKCDNRKCFNPDHLFFGTQQDNIRDAVSKGRRDYKRHGRLKVKKGRHKRTKISNPVLALLG